MNEQCSCSTNVCIIIHNYLSNLAYMHISQLTDWDKTFLANMFRIAFPGTKQ